MVRQMEEFRDSLPASELEHLWLVNTFVCMHLSLVSLTKKRTRQQQFPIFFTSSLYEEVFIQHTKNNEFKIETKTSIEEQSEGEVKATWPIDENESKKDALSEARDFGDSNPVALERTVW